MKLVSAISIALLFTSSLVAGRGYQKIAVNAQPVKQETAATEISDFEKAVEIIKKYETLHAPKHWPLVGYGHKVLPGEKFSRRKALSEKEADALLRKDLLKNCAVFRSFGVDSLLLGVLAYNIGSGAALRSAVARKLKSGNRDIYDSYIAHSKYRGKTHRQIRNRRIEEFELLFIKDSGVAASGNRPDNKSSFSVNNPAKPGGKKDEETLSVIPMESATPWGTPGSLPHHNTHNKYLACLSEYQRYYSQSRSLV